MIVTILQDGIYSEFLGNKSGAVQRQKGDIVDYPKWYALSLIDSGHVIAGRVGDDRPVSMEEVTIEEVAIQLDVTNRARELAEELGIPLGEVEGTGKDGKITLADVRGAIEEDDDGAG